jgi:tetratricopeptide (TPR) repeat protein
LLAVLTASCAVTHSTSPIVRQQCYNAAEQLASVLNPLQAARARGCAPGNFNGQSECDTLEQEVQRLAAICPGNQPILMANAVIAYDEHRAAESQQYLDQILAEPGTHPDAAALRGQLAIEAGNIPYAIKMLDEQIVLAPAHAGLRETRAAALYVYNRFDEARTDLALAEKLGAPRWRVAYHLGLIEEANARRDEAARLYTESLAGNPGFAPADARLKALQAGSVARP